MNDGENAYTYDDEGNRTSKGATKYHWDHRNRLVKVVNGDQTVEYKYDHLNRLYKRTVSDGDEIFVHNGWQIVCSLKDKKLAHRYLWGATQDELLCDNDDYVLTDHMNTVRDVVKSDGSVVKHLEYNAFGELQGEPGDDFAFAYTGKLFDAKTGLQWNINRWYDAKIGRWLSEDPIGFKGRSANLFSYVSNCPLFLLDIFGKQVTEIRKDYPLVFSTETWAILVLLFDMPDSDTIRVRPRMKRPNSEKFRASWNSEMMTTVPEDWERDYFTRNLTRDEYYDLDDQTGVWFYPNLSEVLSATGPRYGGYDPYKEVDNDFAAILIHHYGADGTLRTSASNPLISAKWHSVDVTNAGSYDNSHVAGSEQFLLTPNKCGGYYVIAMMYADMMGFGSGPRCGPTAKDSNAAGQYLVVVKMEYEKNPTVDGYNIKIKDISVPDEFLSFDWDVWNSKNTSKTSE